MNGKFVERKLRAAFFWSMGTLPLLFVAPTAILAFAVAPFSDFIRGLFGAFLYFVVLWVWSFCFVRVFSGRIGRGYLPAYIFCLFGMLFSLFVSWFFAHLQFIGGGVDKFYNMLAGGLPALAILSLISVMGAVIAALFVVGSAQKLGFPSTPNRS